MSGDHSGWWWLRRWLRHPLLAVGAAWGVLVRRRIHRMLPGLFGAAGASVAAGQLAGHIFGLGLAPWVSLAFASGFTLWIGAAINQVPRAPRPPGDV